MFCPNCGIDLPDGSPFCPNCGASMEQPVYADPYAPAPQAKTGFSGAKLIALILTVACIVTMVLSYVVVTNTSVEDLAIIQMADVDTDEIDDMKDDMEESYDELKDYCKELDLSSKEEKKVDKLLDAYKALSKSISINNLKKAVKAVEEAAEIDEIGDHADALEDMEEASQILNTISTVFLVAMLFCLAFCALGGFFRVRGLVITGLIFSVIYGFVFCGILFVILFAVIDIALCVFIGKAKKEAVAAY